MSNRTKQIKRPSQGAGELVIIPFSQIEPKWKKAPAGLAAPSGVPRGWTPTAWAQRLRYLARCCGETNPERAAELLEWAERIEQNHE